MWAYSSSATGIGPESTTFYPSDEPARFVVLDSKGVFPSHGIKRTEYTQALTGLASPGRQTGPGNGELATMPLVAKNGG